MSEISEEIQSEIHKIQTAIFGDSEPTIEIVSDPKNPYRVDWSKKKINFSLKADYGLSNDIDVAVHEMAHYMIASVDGLHTSAWGMKNPYFFWDGASFSPIQAPNGAPASNTEAKVWAWQHLIYVMSGMREIDDVDKRPEARWLDDSPKQNMLDIVDGMIRGHIADIQKKFPNGTWMNEIKRKFSEIPYILEYEKTQLIKDDFQQVSETHLGFNVYLLLEHNSQGWFQSILAHKDDETNEYDGYHTHVITRSPERIQAFVRAAETVFDERPFIQRPHLISVSSKENLESISETGFNPYTYFIDSMYPSAEELVEYYSECLEDEGKTPIVLAIEKQPGLLKIMEPDYPSIDEPISTVIGLSDTAVSSAWQQTKKTTEECLSLVGSCRSKETIPSHKIVILENDTERHLTEYVRELKNKRRQNEMAP